MRKKYCIGLCVIMLGGCGWGAKHGTQDAPIDTNKQDNTTPYIINMPDGFMNLAFKCHGSDGIYAHTREAAPVIVPNDPNCPPSTTTPR